MVAILIRVCLLFFRLPEDKVAMMIEENGCRAAEDERAVEAALAAID